MLEIERFVVDGGRALGQGKNVLARRFLIHRDQQVDLFLARDITVFAGANRVPGGQARDIRGKKVLAADRNAHREDALEQHAVRRLRTGAVYCRYLNAEVVGD